jgi:hypothetical protein
MPDPTMPSMDVPLSEYTAEQLSFFIDDHIIMALVAGDTLYAGERYSAEDYLRDRLVAISDSWDTTEGLEAEHNRRRNHRMMNMLRSEEVRRADPPPKGLAQRVLDRIQSEIATSEDITGEQPSDA